MGNKPNDRTSSNKNNTSRPRTNESVYEKRKKSRDDMKMQHYSSCLIFIAPSCMCVPFFLIEVKSYQGKIKQCGTLRIFVSNRKCFPFFLFLFLFSLTTDGNLWAMVNCRAHPTPRTIQFHISINWDDIKNAAMLSAHFTIGESPDWSRLQTGSESK